jgi:hypothetical protein
MATFIPGCEPQMLTVHSQLWKLYFNWLTVKSIQAVRIEFFVLLKVANIRCFILIAVEIFHNIIGEPFIHCYCFYDMATFITGCEPQMLTVHSHRQYFLTMNRKTIEAYILSVIKNKYFKFWTTTIFLHAHLQVVYYNV